MNVAADLIAAARAKREAGDLEAAIDSQSKAIASLREGAPVAALAHALRHLAEMAAEAGLCDLAVTSSDEAMALYRETDGIAPLDLANAIRVEAVVSEACREPELAIAAWQQACEAYRPLDDVFALLGVAGNPGLAEAEQRVEALRQARD